MSGALKDIITESPVNAVPTLTSSTPVPAYPTFAFPVKSISRSPNCWYKNAEK